MMRPFYCFMIVLTGAMSITAQEHRIQMRNVLDAQRRLAIDIEVLEATIATELAIAERLYDAVVVINDPQEHNGAERAMEHVRTARRLAEEGDEAIHLREIIGDATDLVEEHRTWIHSSDLFEVHERYHHEVIHPLTMELARDLVLLQDLSRSGVESVQLDSTRAGIEETLLRLLQYSDLRYE
ncbi:MAG: hypothetical protein KY432_03310 [Acidobacteria bacterium]|nr:hypothetical protein [Acidobacteriota bacterium]